MRILTTAAGIAAWLLPACSSTGDGSRSEFGPTYNERMAAVDKILKKQDFSARSSFESQLPRGMTDKEYKASSITSREAGGMKAFSGADTSHRTKAFAESGRTSRAGEKMAREAREQSKLASKLFRMPENQFDSKTSSAGARTFRQGDETFAARDNPVASRELERNKKPVIMEPEKPTYSESEVKRLLEK